MTDPAQQPQRASQDEPVAQMPSSMPPHQPQHPEHQAHPQQSQPQPQTNAPVEQPDDSVQDQTGPMMQQDPAAVVPAQILPEEVLLVWDAPSRPYKKRDREYYTTIAIIIFLLSIILFFAGQFLLIAVIVSAGFVSYMLASIPPVSTTHAITTYGVRTGDKLYHWGELGRFWFTTSLGQRVLHIEYFHRIIGSIVLLLGDIAEDEMKSVLLDFLHNETPLPTFVDKASSWLQKKFPLDKNG